MRVLVLGGNGLFGRKTIVRLAQDPAVTAVVSFDVVPTKPWVLKEIENVADKFHFVRGDVGELEDILNAIKTYQIDRLVNLAFLLPGNVETQPRLSTRVNAMGMCNSFEAAKLMGISRVIYASSEGVYGPQDEYGDRDVTEDDRRHPGSGYALMKLFAEIIADQYSQFHGLKMTALRPHIGYGHGGLMPLMIKQFCDIVSLPAVGKPFSVDADGTNTVSLTSADDVGEFIRILCHAESSPHPAYNIGGPPMSMRDVAADRQEVLSGRPDQLRQAGAAARSRPDGHPLAAEHGPGQTGLRVLAAAARGGHRAPHQRRPPRGRPPAGQSQTLVSAVPPTAGPLPFPGRGPFLPEGYCLLLVVVCAHPLHPLLTQHLALMEMAILSEKGESNRDEAASPLLTLTPLSSHNRRSIAVNGPGWRGVRGEARTSS